MLKPSIAHSLVRANGLSLSLVRLSAANSSISGPTGVKMSGPYSGVSECSSNCQCQCQLLNALLLLLTAVGASQLLAYRIQVLLAEHLDSSLREARVKIRWSLNLLQRPSALRRSGHPRLMIAGVTAPTHKVHLVPRRFNGPLAERYGVNASNISLGARSYLYAAHAQARFLSFVKHRFAVVLLSSCHNLRRTRTGATLKAILETKAALGVITAWSSLQTRRG